MKHLNVVDQAQEVNERVDSMEEILGRGLLQPCNSANSASRKLMFNQHIEQKLCLISPEVPLVGTGYENTFGEYSSSFLKSDCEYKVIAKIDKFNNLKDYHYFMIMHNLSTNTLDVIERVNYKHTTEKYGYLLNNDTLDSYAINTIIPCGTVIQKSTSFDDYNNHLDGVNLLTAYISCDDTLEDPIIVSESAAKKLSAPIINKCQIIINDNDILLNLYGNDSTYKTFPDIGEDVKDGILCAVRREKKEESLFTQAFSRLQDILMSDDKYTPDGRVIDINVYCNNPEALQESYYNSQIRGYYNDNIRFCQELVAEVEKYPGITLSYDLNKLYTNSKRILDGVQIFRDRAFSNIILEVVTMKENVLEGGDKLSNRYGGKGVVSKVVSDEKMPILDNGERIELIFNSSTCVNRLNAGQLFETSVTHVGNRIIDFINTGCLDVGESLDLYLKYISILNPEQAAYIANSVENLDDDDLILFLNSVSTDKGIEISMKPISDCLTIDKIAELYEAFPFAKPYTMKSIIKDSNGNERFVPSQRPITAGRQYIYRLKQYAEEKFSVTSLSSTNIRNENSKSKANKMYRAVFGMTPIRFGDMETGDMAHIGMEFVIINLMLYSTSPHARRLTEQLLTGDPFNIDIKLDKYATSRNVEILNAYLKTMGLKLEFYKMYKKHIHPLVHYPIQHKDFEYIPSYRKDPIIHYAEGEHINTDMFRRIYEYEHSGKGIIITKPIIHLKDETPLLDAKLRSIISKYKD